MKGIPVMLKTPESIKSKDIVLLDHKLSIYSFDMKDEHPGEVQNIYIIDPEIIETKDNDWYIIWNKVGTYFLCRFFEGGFHYSNGGGFSLSAEVQDRFAKIICSTDCELEVMGEQAGDDNVWVNPMPQLSKKSKYLLMDYYNNNDGVMPDEVEVIFHSGIRSYGRGFISAKIKTNPEGTIDITIPIPEEKMYSRKEVKELTHAAFHHKDVDKGLPFDYTDDGFNVWTIKNL